MNTQRLAQAARLLLLPFLILNFAHARAFAGAAPRLSSRISPGPSCGTTIGAGKTTIIVPIGGTEQNGPAMALGKHNRRVEAA